MSKTSYQKEYRKNMTDEQKQRYREARIRKYQNMTDEEKQKYKDIKKKKKYKENMTDEQKQKYRESEKQYR